MKSDTLSGQISEIEKMDRNELKRVIEALYGYDGMPHNPDGYSDESLRAEAIAQIRREWRETDAILQRGKC